MLIEGALQRWQGVVTSSTDANVATMLTLLACAHMLFIVCRVLARIAKNDDAHASDLPKMYAFYQLLKSVNSADTLSQPLWPICLLCYALGFLLALLSRGYMGYCDANGARQPNQVI